MNQALRRGFTALSILLLSILASPSRGDRPPSRYLNEAFSRGETLNLTILWLRVAGATGKMTIAPVPNDPGRLKIVSVAQSNSFFSKIYPVRDMIESVVERATFSTQRYQKTLKERNSSKQELTVIDEGRRVAIRKGAEVRVPKPVFDPLSIIYYLRTRDLVPGRKLSFTMIADGKVYTLEADVKRREKIQTEAGSFRTVVVEPKMSHGGIYSNEDTKLTVWYSDDDRRLPVRIRSVISAGTITANLRSSYLGTTPPVHAK